MTAPLDALDAPPSTVTELSLLIRSAPSFAGDPQVERSHLVDQLGSGRWVAAVRSDDSTLCLQPQVVSSLTERRRVTTIAQLLLEVIDGRRGLLQLQPLLTRRAEDGVGRLVGSLGQQIRLRGLQIQRSRPQSLEVAMVCEALCSRELTQRFPASPTVSPGPTPRATLARSTRSGSIVSGSMSGDDLQRLGPSTVLLAFSLRTDTDRWRVSAIEGSASAKAA